MTTAKQYPRGAITRIAKRFGVTQSHVSRVASGERPNARILAALKRETEKKKVAR